MKGSLLIIERSGGPLYYAKWRDVSARKVKRRLGPAWVVWRDGTLPAVLGRAARPPARAAK